MKVKNGTASSVSFDITPQRRSGSAWKSEALEQAQLDAEQPEEDAVGGERERDRVADQQEHDQRREHDRRDVVDEEGGHQALPSASLRISSASSARRHADRAA